MLVRVLTIVVPGTKKGLRGTVSFPDSTSGNGGGGEKIELGVGKERDKGWLFINR